jgi:hypothetical protein
MNSLRAPVRDASRRGEGAREKRRRVTVQLSKSRRDEECRAKRARRATEGEEKEAVKSESQVQKWCAALAGGSDPLRALVGLREITCGREIPFDAFIETGAVVAVISCLDHPQLQLEALWTLTNLLSGPTAVIEHVFAHRGHLALPPLLRSPDRGVRDQALWALSNIAGESDPEYCRRLLAEADFLPTLMEMFVRERAGPTPHIDAAAAAAQTLKHATWALQNVCRFASASLTEQETIACIQVLVSEAANCQTAPETAREACYALKCLADAPGPVPESLCAAKVLRALTRCLGTRTVELPAVSALENLLSRCSADVTREAVAGGLLAMLAPLLASHASQRSQEMACRVVSHVAFDGADELAGRHKVATGVTELLLYADGGAVREEAAHAVSAMVKWGERSTVECLVRDYKTLEALVSFLDDGAASSEALLQVLEALGRVLELGAAKRFPTRGSRLAEPLEALREMEADDKVAALRESGNEQVARAAERLTDAYFEAEEGGDAAPWPRGVSNSSMMQLD